MKAANRKKQHTQREADSGDTQQIIRQRLKQASLIRTQIAGYLTPGKLSAFKNQGRQ
jgi:hypothetical protein